ICKNAWKEYHA
ncbi:Competence protein ComM, partial [Haemophilus influenzae]